MSFEGYAQIICVNGHRYDDAYRDSRNCYVCGGEPAWVNVVDQTNNPGDGAVPDTEFAHLQLTPEVVKTCGECGATRCVTEATYRVPTVAEAAAMRYGMRYVDNGRLEYGRWHCDAVGHLIWTPYQSPQATADGAQEPD